MAARTKGRLTHRVEERLRQRNIVKQLERLYRIIPGYKPNAKKWYKIKMATKYISHLATSLDLMTVCNLMAPASTEDPENILPNVETLFQANIGSQVNSDPLPLNALQFPSFENMADNGQNVCGQRDSLGESLLQIVKEQFVKKYVTAEDVGERKGVPKAKKARTVEQSATESNSAAKANNNTKPPVKFLVVQKSLQSVNLIEPGLYTLQTAVTDEGLTHYVLEKSPATVNLKQNKCSNSALRL